MFKVISGILTLTMTGQAFAASCTQPVYALSTGQASPCDGYLFSVAKEAELRLMDQDYTLLKDEDAIKDKQLTLYKQEVTDLDTAVDKQKQEIQLWQKASEDATQKYVTLEERAAWRDYLMLGLGVGLTIGAAYAVGAASRGGAATVKVHK